MTNHNINNLSYTKSHTVTKYWRIIVSLALCAMADLASLFFIQPMLPLLMKKYQVPVSQIGIIMSAETAMIAIGLLFTGSIADKIGRKPYLTGALFVAGVLTILCVLPHTFIQFVLLRGLLGLCLSGIAAASTAYISEEVAPAMAATVTGYFVFGNSVGGMSGRVIASQLMEYVSTEIIFIGFGILLLITGLLVLFLLPKQQAFRQSASQLTAIVKQGALHIKNSTISLFFVFSFCIFGVFTALYNYLAFRLAMPPYHLSHSQAGLISISFILSLISAPNAGKLAARYGIIKVFRYLLIMMLIGILLTLLSNTSAFIIGMVIFTACFFGCHALGLSWVSTHAEKMKAQACALYLFSYYIGGAVVGYLSGLFYSSAGWYMVIVFNGLLLLISLGLTIILARKVRKYECKTK